MRLPRLNDPERYAGLYVFDFGDQVAVGYTAAEIAVLIESERYADGTVYKIHRALPDGTMELRGVSRGRFQLEDGLFFYRREAGPARRDFDDLRALADASTPPCRAKLHLARLDAPGNPFVVALIFPAEYTDEMGHWLTEHDYAGGDYVEGGPSQVTGYYQARRTLLAQHQLWGVLDKTSRSAEEVLASTHVAVQR